LIATVRVTRLTDNARIIAATGQQEGHIGVGKQVDFVYRTPGRDMVPLRADRKDGHADIGQRYRPVADAKMPFREVII
ncbi:hypothetical protein MO867_23165, partial [Microbulbifer sp. OS29]